jgi:hypothetical protein
VKAVQHLLHVIVVDTVEIALGDDIDVVLIGYGRHGRLLL